MAVLKRSPNICSQPSPGCPTSGAVDGAVDGAAGGVYDDQDLGAAGGAGDVHAAAADEGEAGTSRQPVCADTWAVKTQLQPSKSWAIAERSLREEAVAFKYERIAGCMRSLPRRLETNLQCTHSSII